MVNKSSDQYSGKEARERFEAALRGARLVGHKPMSEISPRAGKRKRQARPAKKKPGR